MITIAIVEDDKEYRSQYRDYLKQMEAQMGESFQIREFEDGDGILENYRADYDIILMDIEMSFVNGMEAAEEIRKLDHEVVIIFITNMPQYVMDGYKVQAFDYILKPITYYAFSELCCRLWSGWLPETASILPFLLKTEFSALTSGSWYMWK